MIPLALRDALADDALRGAPLVVYVWCWTHLEKHGHRPVKVSGVAYDLRIKRHRVGHALRLLTARGYLEEGPREGAVRSFRVMETRNTLIGPQSGHSRSA